MLLQKFKSDFDMSTTPQFLFTRSEFSVLPPTKSTPSTSFLLFRLSILLYFLSTTIYYLVCLQRRNLYFIFLTNWSFTLQLLYATLYFFRVVWLTFKSKEEKRLPLIDRIIWVMINLLAVLPYVVTLGYWVFLNGGALEKNRACEQVSNYLVHAANSPLVLLDMLYIGVPMRISHMIYPIIGGIVYVTFTGFYELANGTYAKDHDSIYPILNWKNSPGSAVVTSLIGIIATAVIYLIFGYGLYRLRLKIASKLIGFDEKYRMNKFHRGTCEEIVDQEIEAQKSYNTFVEVEVESNKIESVES